MLGKNNIRAIYNRYHSNSLVDKRKKYFLRFLRREHTFILLIAVLLILIIIRLLFLNLNLKNNLINYYNKLTTHQIALQGERGIIVDRNNNILATNTLMSSLWIDPKRLTSLNQTQFLQLSKILNLSTQELNNKLSPTKSTRFVYLKRFISTNTAKQVLALNIAGIYNMQEYKRFYPEKQLTSFIGNVDINNHGNGGVEYANNQLLTENSVTNNFIANAKGEMVEPINNFITPKNGTTVKLTIDTDIQNIAYNALNKQIIASKADGGSAVVIDAKNGNILAMLSIKHANNIPQNAFITEMYEPGSIIKPLLVAKALSLNLIQPNDKFKTTNLMIDRKNIKDAEKHVPILNVTQILQKSSDVGAAKIGLKFPKQELYNYYNDIGIGSNSGIKFPGATKGVLHDYHQWSILEQAEISFGYGIGINLMQMARAYSIFSNHGCMLNLNLYLDNTSTSCRQVVTENAADTVKNMLSSVVTNHGTAALASTLNYDVIGKTGTSHQLENKKYINAYNASFVGIAPTVKPNFIIAVLINHPRIGGYYGGMQAAPVFSQIAEQSLRLIGTKPNK